MERTAIVIGAGFAGLVAAERLVDAGWDVTVLEARRRVGGRAWTGRLPNGAIIERGAEWVEDAQVEMLALCARLGIPLARTGMSYHDRRPVGGPSVDDADLVAGRATVRELLAALGDAAFDLSVADAIDRLPVSDGVRVAFRARVACTSGAPAEELAAVHLQMLATAPDDADSPRIATGSDAPCRALAAALGERVRLDAPVLELAVDDAGVAARTPAGAFRAAHVVLALPKPIVARPPFVDVLPAAVVRTLDQLGVAHAAKLFVPLTGPATPGALLDVRSAAWVWTANQGADGLRPVLAGFAGSLPMLDRLDVAHGGSTWARVVAELVPGLPLDIAAAGAQTWHDDPWAGGVYTCLRPGDRPDDAVLRRRHGRVVMAGEFTDDVWSGYMEGAIRSGQRAAHLLDPSLPAPAAASH